ncbi:MAG: Holliday junction branch migration protein RuvA [Chlamydia sp.]
MYDYIRGSIAKIDSTGIVLDVQGVGYRIYAMQQTIQEAMRFQNRAEPILLFIEFLVREESQTLYGFISEIERSLFRLLLGISGVGSKLAIQIMNRGPCSEVLYALSNRDILWLSSISGIGKKTAERLALETADKAKEMLLLIPKSFSEIKSDSGDSCVKTQLHSMRKIDTEKSLYTQGIEALISLGLTESEAARCVQDAINHAMELESEEISDITRLIQLSLLYRKRRS